MKLKYGCHAKSRRGRHQINLSNTITIKSDLNLKRYSVDCIEDLYLLRDVAAGIERSGRGVVCLCTD